MKTRAAVLVAFAAFALGVAGGILGRDYLPGGGGGRLYPPRCEAHVKLSVAKNEQNKPYIVVDPPETVCLARGRPLIWDVAGRGKVTIVFAEQLDENNQKYKGPFPYKSTVNPFNKGIGVYERDIDAMGVGPGPVDSNPAERIAFDRPWKYTVKWRLPGTGTDQPPDSDPAVCVRD